MRVMIIDLYIWRNNLEKPESALTTQLVMERYVQPHQATQQTEPAKELGQAKQATVNLLVSTSRLKTSAGFRAAFLYFKSY